MQKYNYAQCIYTSETLLKLFVSAWGSLKDLLKVWNVPLVMTGPVKTLTGQPLNVKLGRSTGALEFAGSVGQWMIGARIFCQEYSVNRQVYCSWGLLDYYFMSARASQASCCSSNSGRSYSKTANALVTSLDLSGLVWNLMVPVKPVIGFSTHSSFSKYVLHHSIITFVQSNWYRMVFQDLQGGCEVEGMFLFGPF